jgi:hypothetical protein
VLPVVVFLPPPAALTPLLNNHLPEIQSHNRVTTQMFQRISDAESILSFRGEVRLSCVCECFDEDDRCTCKGEL